MPTSTADVKRLDVALMEPKQHQDKALVDLVEYLYRRDRVKVIMACGTGKTLIQMWATQRLAPKRVLVLVPTLALLKQVRDKWVEQNDVEKWGGALRTLCVCSDGSIGRSSPNDRRRSGDQDHITFSELEFPTCTDPDVVNAFFDHPGAANGSVSVVFSTYLSAHIVGAAMLRRPAGDGEFDVGVFDEAHKTVGTHGKSYGFALHDHNIRIIKRLFFTATPRLIVPAQRGRKVTETRSVVSMDDQAIYGPTAHMLSFKDAADARIIVPYRVIISLVDDEQFTSTDIENRGQTVLANQFVLRQAMETHGLRKAVTFHATVDSADAFTSSFKSHQPNTDIECFHVSGRQNASKREATMSAFAQSRFGFVTNSRCLTEGVDVPAVDVVAFMDRRKSAVDIVQAVGRSLRLSDGKTHGHVLLPIHLNLRLNESVEEALERADLKTVSDVLRALFENDGNLLNLFRSALTRDGASGMTGDFDDGLFSLSGEGATSPKPDHAIQIDFGSLPRSAGNLDASRLFSVLRTKILAAATDYESWDSSFDSYSEFVASNSGRHPSGTSANRHERKLGLWLCNQRQSLDRFDRCCKKVLALESVDGFVWNVIDAKWHRNFVEYKAFLLAHGRRPKQGCKTALEKRLITWEGAQRKILDPGDLTDSKVQLLLQIPQFFLPANEAQWDNTYTAYVLFVRSNGRHPLQTSKEPKERWLGKWATTQRLRLDSRDKTDVRVAELDRIEGFVWAANEEGWMRNYQLYLHFTQSQGRLPNARSKDPSEGKIGRWTETQRNLLDRNDATNPRVALLSSVPGFKWSVLGDLWEATFGLYRTFVRTHGRVPSSYASKGSAERSLGRWAQTQRSKLDPADCANPRVCALNSIKEFTWSKSDAVEVQSRDCNLDRLAA